MSITIELPDKDRQELGEFGREHGLSLEQAAQEALRRFLSIQRFDKLSAEGEKHMRAAGFTSEEEILRAFST